MSSNQHNQNPLRVYIKAVLKEEDGGGDGGGFDGGYGGDWGGYGGGGHGYAYGRGISDDFFTDIWNAFVDPLKATAAFTERFSSKIQNIAGKMAESIMAIALPGYSADYEKYDQEEQERLDAIHEKYKEVFARTEANLFTGDAALMAFLYAPHQYLTTRLLKHSPDAALDIINVLGGNNPAVTGFVDRAKDFTKRFKHIGRMRGGPTSPNPIPIDDNLRAHKLIGGNTLSEGLFDKIKSMFSSNELEQAIENSPMARSMQKDAENYVQSWTDGVVELVKNNIDLENSDKLNDMTKGKFHDLTQSLQGDDKIKAAKLAVVGTKKAIKNQAVKDIESKIKQLPGGSSHPLGKLYQSGISRIKSL